MSLQENAKREQIEVPVHIPNLDGTAISETIMVEVEGIRDTKTGELFLDGEALEFLDKVKARHMGLLLPDEIKALRQRLCLTQEVISRLLKIGEKTYTRWETGRCRPSQAMNVILRGIQDGIIPVNWLQALSSKHFKWIVATPLRTRVVRWSSSSHHELRGTGISPPVAPTVESSTLLRSQTLFERNKSLTSCQIADEKFAITA